MEDQEQDECTNFLFLTKIRLFRFDFSNLGLPIFSLEIVISYNHAKYINVKAKETFDLMVAGCLGFFQE